MASDSHFLPPASGCGSRFIDPRPLWLDEALIALNILSRSPVDLSPLADSQIAPLGFLWSEWLVTRLAGTGELALRFIPLVASVIALLSFARLAGRLLDARLAMLATALAAVSPLLIYYSAEVKPYAFDWMFAVLLMLATLDIFAAEGARILARPAEEITLLFGYLRELRETLPAWLEMRGATRLAREENHPLLRLRYRPPRQ